MEDRSEKCEKKEGIGRNQSGRGGKEFGEMRKQERQRRNQGG